MKQSTYKGIPVTIYEPKESRLFNAMLLFKSGLDYKEVAKRLNIDFNHAFKMKEFLKKVGEI